MTDQTQSAVEAPELWCVHIIGPDDVIAYPDREAAEREATEINKGLQAMSAKHARDENWPHTTRAVAVLWPHSAQSHAVDLARNIQQMECNGNG